MTEKSNLGDKLKLATAGALLTFGLATGGSALAQQDAATEAAEQVEDVASDAEDEADGFDDWGLLGLLGLLGLGGLRRGEPEVRTVEQRQERVTTPVVDTTRVARDDVDSIRVTRDNDTDNTPVTRDDRDRI